MGFRLWRVWCFLVIFPVVNGAAGGKTVRTAKLPDPDPFVETAETAREADRPLELSGDGEPAGNWNRGPGNGLSVMTDQVSLAPPAETSARSQAESRAETVLRALAGAYPDRIGAVEYIDSDWTVQVYGERFYYAQGRMLPASMRDNVKDYDPQPFYRYLAELPPWRQPTAEESEQMREQEKRRQARPPKRSPYFYDTLWRIHNQDESWDHVKQIRFLGHPVLVHYSLLVQLSLVEEQILKVSKTNDAVRRWVSNIKSIDGWNWRNIAESHSRSYHAYGAAIDFLPKSLGGLETYWLWTARNTPEWWTVPYAQRFHPPPEVITAFESYGFVWGGKWHYYDTMHFEYRPEILTLSGIPQTDLRELR